MSTVPWASRYATLSIVVMGFGSDEDVMKHDDLLKTIEEDHYLTAIATDAKTVFHRRYDGKFDNFFKDFMKEVMRAVENGDDPIQEVGEWIQAEVESVQA